MSAEILRTLERIETYLLVMVFAQVLTFVLLLLYVASR